jgi:hypothetical protein
LAIEVRVAEGVCTNSPTPSPVTWATMWVSRAYARDVERDAEEDVGRALVELAADSRPSAT